MSLASTLRPVGLSFRREQVPPKDAAQSTPFQHETNYLNLHRTLLRLQHLILLTPVPSTSTDTSFELSPLQKQIQAELWSPLPYNRNKWLHDIEGARTLLLQLERQAQGIRVQRAKYEAVKDLAEKRSTIKKLRHRVEEIGREIELMGAEQYKPPYMDEGAETLFDVLQEQSRAHRQKQVVDETTGNEVLKEGRPALSLEEDHAINLPSNGPGDATPPSATIRRRGGGGGKQDASSDTGKAHMTGFSKAQSTERSLLDSSRVHGDLTASLVSMAAQLKQQSRALQFSLDQDKGIVGRALEGLDVSLTGMQAASKNMAFLKRMSEEEGWFGRLKLYGMIFAMWVVAFLLVFVCPKLRF